MSSLLSQDPRSPTELMGCQCKLMLSSKLAIPHCENAHPCGIDPAGIFVISDIQLQDALTLAFRIINNLAIPVWTCAPAIFLSKHVDIFMYALLRTRFVPLSLVYPGGGPCPKKIPDMMLPGWLSYTVLISYVQKD